MSIDQHTARATGRKRLRRLAFVAFAGLTIALAAIGRALLYRAADLSHVDLSPLPRPRIDAPYIQTPERIAMRMVELADIRPQDVVYDLGCGDGRLVIDAAARTGCHGVGFDKDPQRVAEARENVKRRHLEDLVRIEQRDIFTVDLSQANVVVMYLLPWMVEALVPRFAAMPPGSRIVSHDFRIEGLEPDKEIVVDVGDVGDHEHRYLLLYVTPLRQRPPAPRKTSREKP